MHGRHVIGDDVRQLGVVPRMRDDPFELGVRNPRAVKVLRQQRLDEGGVRAVQLGNVLRRRRVVDLPAVRVHKLVNGTAPCRLRRRKKWRAAVGS